MPYLDITNRQRTNAFEWKYTMLLCNDDGSDATQLAGSRVVESFGRPRIYRNRLRDSDLDPQFETAHRGSASYVCSRMETGRAGRFKVEENATFFDFHGGNGLSGQRNLVFWFTDEALRRGIGWTFIQTYRLNGQVVGRFHVSRIFTRGSPYRLEVIKTAV